MQKFQRKQVLYWQHGWNHIGKIEYVRGELCLDMYEILADLNITPTSYAPTLNTLKPISLALNILHTMAISKARC